MKTPSHSPLQRGGARLAERRMLKPVRGLARVGDGPVRIRPGSAIPSVARLSSPSLSHLGASVRSEGSVPQGTVVPGHRRIHSFSAQSARRRSSGATACSRCRCPFPRHDGRGGVSRRQGPPAVRAGGNCSSRYRRAERASFATLNEHANGTRAAHGRGHAACPSSGSCPGSGSPSRCGGGKTGGASAKHWSCCCTSTNANRSVGGGAEGWRRRK